MSALETYQDRLEAALKTGARAYGTAFNDPPAGLWVHEIDTEKRIVRVSPPELRALGYSEAQMLGLLAFSFIVMDGGSARAIDQKLAGTRELKPFVRTFKKADGAPLPLILCDRHIKDTNGRILGLGTAMTRAAGV